MSLAVVGLDLAFFAIGVGFTKAMFNKRYDMSTRPKTPPPRVVDPEPPFDYYAHAIQLQNRENARLLARCPDAFWLDPVWWGDAPAVADIGIRLPPIEEPIAAEHAPPCPNDCDAPVLVMADHGGVASLWSCTLCGTDYTRKGKSKVAGMKARRRLEQVSRQLRDLEYRTLRDPVTQPMEKRMIAPALPCGCTGEVATRSYPSAGFDMGRYAMCKTCNATWDYAPKMDDTGNPRKMVRGEVQWPDGKLGPTILPCGCAGSITHVRGPGYGFSRCDTCRKWWEPASNDKTGRVLAQGERVHERREPVP